jgi:hypothetical protein
MPNQIIIDELPKHFIDFGRRRTEPILRMVCYRDDISLKDAITAAYLHGVWDGYRTAEKQVEAALKTPQVL